jgi:hypothetical protein
VNELNDLEILLDRALPDPMAFAERVLQQILDRLAYSSPGANPMTVMTSPGEGLQSGAAGTDSLEEQTLVLAAALGACTCWGSDPDCAVCAGHGTAGWMPPDPTLYDVYISPAADRMSDARQSAGVDARSGAPEPSTAKKGESHDRGSGGEYRSRNGGV